MSVLNRRWSSGRSVAMVLALATGLLASSVATADVLKYAPTDALGVFKIKTIGATNKKAAALFTKMGVAALRPELADPLAALKAGLGVKEGVNEAGDFGFILLPAAVWPKTDGENAADAKPAIVVLVPVSDYKAFLGNFASAKTEGDVTEMTNNGVVSYITNWGEYAAMSPKKEYFAAKGEGLKLNPAGAAEFESKDMVLWANIPALKAVLGPKIAEHREKLLEQAVEGLKNNPQAAKYGPVVRAGLTQVFAAAETFLGDSRGATFSLDISDAGLNYAVSSEFAEGTYLGKLVSSVKPASEQSFTAGLPAAPYIFYGGAAMDGAVVSGLVNDLSAPILKALGEVDGANAGEVTKTVDALTAMMKSVKSSNFGMIAPRGAIGTESLIQAAYTVKGDAKAYKAGMATYAQSYAKLITSFMTGPASLNIVFKPDAKTVDGVTFDTLVTGPNPAPKTPEEAQVAQALTFMYGPGGLTYATGAADDTTAVMGMGLSDATLSKLIASAKSGEDSLGKLPTVASTTKALPARPVGEFYFALDELVRTGILYARQFGMPVNVQLPDALPPIGVAIEANGGTARVDTHIPAELIQSLVAAYIQFQMQMGGGGGAPPGGGF